MALFLAVLALIGLLIFLVFGILWLVSPPRRALWAQVALIGLLIWAVASIISLFDTVF
jgi:hypothetical protein